MGVLLSCEEESTVHVREAPKPKQIYGDEYLRQLPDGWIKAAGKDCLNIINSDGLIWHYWSFWPPRNVPYFYFAMKTLERPEGMAWFPEDGTFGAKTVRDSRISALSKVYGPPERVQNPDDHCHDGVSALAGQVCFYDYDFKIVDREDRTTQLFDLTAEREICGIACMHAMLKYFPIGKNYIETDGPNLPYLMFAIPKSVVMFVKVNGMMIGYETNPGSPNGEKCFLHFDSKVMETCRFLPIFILARKKKVDKWSCRSDYPLTCLKAFARLFSSLQPGQNNIETWFQFTYTTDCVSTLKAEVDLTQSDHKGVIYTAEGFTESRLMPIRSKQTNTEDLIIQPNDTGKLIMSDVIGAGAFTVIVPEKGEFNECMKNFYGFEDET